MTERSIIDPPVGPYSSYADIAEWLEQLNRIEDSVEKTDAIAAAERWLKWAHELESGGEGEIDAT